jgi:hypothetical protein
MQHYSDAGLVLGAPDGTPSGLHARVSGHKPCRIVPSTPKAPFQNIVLQCQAKRSGNPSLFDAAHRRVYFFERNRCPPQHRGRENTHAAGRAKAVARVRDRCGPEFARATRRLCRRRNQKAGKGHQVRNIKAEYPVTLRPSSLSTCAEQAFHPRRYRQIPRLCLYPRPARQTPIFDRASSAPQTARCRRVPFVFWRQYQRE